MIKAWIHKKGWGITIHLENGQPPVYQQLVNQIRFHIASKHLQSGEKLPTIRELAKALKINFNTVAKAYHDLTGQGLLLGRKGGGSFVAEKTFLPKEDKRKKISELYQKWVSEAVSYGIDADDLKRYIHREGLA